LLHPVDDVACAVIAVVMWLVHWFVVVNAVHDRSVNGGAYGNLLASQECLIGRYSVTQSLLSLVCASISHVCMICSH